MYNLYDLGNNKYKMTTHSFGSREGSLRDVVEFAVSMDFEFSEIERALIEMNKLGHNVAHFGMFCGLIYTFNEEKKNVG